MPAACAWASAAWSGGTASGKTMITFTLSVMNVWMSETCWLTDSPAFSEMTLSPARVAAAVSAAWNACSTGCVSCGLANPIVMWLEVCAAEEPLAVDAGVLLPDAGPVDDADVHAATVSDAVARAVASAPFLMFTNALLIRLRDVIRG